MIRITIALAGACLATSAIAKDHVVWLDETRVLVSARVKDDNSVRQHVAAQLKLPKLAKKACGKKGKPVSEGALRVDRAEGSERGLIISEVYVCVAD